MTQEISVVNSLTLIKKKMITPGLIAGIVFLQGAATPVDGSDTWLQWRGSARDGILKGQTWPDSLKDDSLKTMWRVPLGPSYSGPLVTVDRIFVTETRDREKEVVVALDRKTGSRIWSTSWPGAMSVPFFAAGNGSWIRSTPTLHEGDLYVAGMREVLVCLDAAAGKIKWRVDFREALKSALPSFGCVCSPVVDGEHAYMQAGDGFVKLDRTTGDIVWWSLNDGDGMTGGGMAGGAFSSPVIAELAGRRQAIVQTRASLTGVDLETGESLWSISVQAFRGMNILTPVVIGDQIFTSSYGGGSFLYEVSQLIDGQFTVRQVWRNKVQGYMSSPVVVDGHIYLHLRNQRFACLEIATGEERWITQPFGKYWSLIASDHRILALDERGELLLIRVNPAEFELIDRRKISSQPTWAHLAVVEGEIVIRELQGLMSLQWQEQ